MGMTDEAAFSAFLSARSAGLLRPAYLLTNDEGLAEDLVQTAMTKTWFAWGRLDDDPVRYVRRVLVTTSVSWWRRHWRGEVATAVLPEVVGTVDDRSATQDLWTALRHLSVRQRAVVVLRY